MKLGRNDKCWCGSGKKYKQCHLGREDESPVTKGEAIGYTQKNASRKRCYSPIELKKDCSKKIINAHTVSKSGSLKEIADETNHVLGLKISFDNIIKNHGNLVPEKIGINQASTFKGFCSFHDKSLFACVEDKEFVGEQAQCLALMYRSVAKELYAKEGMLNTSEFIQHSGDKGKGIFEQFLIQDFASNHKLGIRAAIEELDKLLESLGRQFNNGSVDLLSHLIIESENPIPVAVSSVFSPTSDFEGKELQDLSDLSTPAEQLVFNSFSSDGKGFVVFSWLKSSKKVKELIESLLRISRSKLFSALVQFFFKVAENSFISPLWWSKLTQEQKEEIQGFIMSGVIFFEDDSNDILFDECIKYQGWEIATIKKLNF